jgi:SWI/SNF-related matrix-associated actin-dependent regulator of chromatin subfamily A member 5
MISIPYKIPRFCPDFRVVGYFGTKEDKKAIEQSYLRTNDFDVLISNYEQMVLYPRVFMKINWTYIIVDEGHRLKNENTSFSKNIRKLKSSNRLILTGTPLQNSLHELWALLNFLMPDLFESSEEFDAW